MQDVGTYVLDSCKIKRFVNQCALKFYGQFDQINVSCSQTHKKSLESPRDENLM